VFAFVVCLVVVAGSIAGVLHILDIGPIDGRSAVRQPATEPSQPRREVHVGQPRGRLRDLLGLAAFVTVAGALVAALFGATALLIDVAMRHAAR